MGNSKGWLGGKEAELEAAEEEEARLAQKESSQKVYEVLKKNKEELDSGGIGMNGGPIESPDYCSLEEKHAPTEQTEKATLLEDKRVPDPLEHIMKATGILSSILREMIAVGGTQSWIASESRPDQRFVAVEAERLRETAERLVHSFKERKLVYEMLKSEISMKRERDRIVGDILLKFAFPYC